VRVVGLGGCRCVKVQCLGVGFVLGEGSVLFGLVLGGWCVGGGLFVRMGIWWVGGWSGNGGGGGVKRLVGMGPLVGREVG